MSIRLLIFLYLLLLGAPFAQAETRAFTPPAPVTLEVWKREIAVFRVPIGPLSPELRRDTALQRIRELPKSALYQKVRTERTSIGNVNGISFLSADRLLFTLIEDDVDPVAGNSIDETAKQVLENLEALRLARLEQRSMPLILQAIGISLVATLLFVVFLWWLARLSKTIRRIFLRHASKSRQLKISNLDLRPAFLQISRRITSFAIAAIGIAAAYAWITAMLAQFPYTAAWAGLLGHNLTLVSGTFLSSVLASLPNVLIVILLFFITRGSVRITDQVLRSFESAADDEKVLSRDNARATRRLASVIIWVFGLVIAYPYIPGSSSEAFKGISILAGLMISLGSTSLVNQIMSGFVVLYSGAVRTGEFARVGDVEGTIIEVGLLSTKVLTAKSEYITVPNAVLIAKDTLNYTRSIDGRQANLSTSVTIGYNTPWRQVHELLLLAAERTPGIRKTPAPQVLQTALSDFYVNYSLRFVPGNISEKVAILSSLHQRIQDVFQQAEVQIMSPNFVSQPDTPVIPPPNS
jgi:small-conductance mechanosensitive channel